MQNSFVERVNGSFCDKSLKETPFASLTEARMRTTGAD